jgi:hypothetical protein
MSVYNRKMFRKKGGGVNGIMASGPELIKAQSGVFANIGMGDPRGFDDTVQTRAPKRMSQFPTSLEQLNTSYIPTSPSLGKQILDTLGFGKYIDIYQSDKDVLEDEKQKVKNIIARSKNEKGENLLKQRVAATQGVDVFETTPEESTNVPGTDLNISDVATRFKQQNKPFFEFLKSVPGLIDKSNEYVQGLASDIVANPTFQNIMMSADPTAGADTGDVSGKTENFLTRNIKDFFNKRSKKIKDELAFLDASGEQQGKDFLPQLEKLEKEERESKKEVPIVKKLEAVGNDSYDQKILSEDKESTDIVTNNTKSKNIKKSETAKEDGLNATANNHNLSTNFLNENDKSITSANLGKVLGYEQFESFSLDERKKMYSNILESVVGDKGNVKTDKDFNIIMTGLLIAAGDSPDALTNITRGLAQGFKMFGDALSEDRKEKRDIQLTATKLAIQAEEAAKERRFKAGEKQLDRITTTINAIIKDSGGNADKFRKTIINTVASDIKTYLPKAERTKFTTYSTEDKAKKIVNIADSISEQAGYGGQKKYDLNSAIEAVKTGDFSKLKFLDINENSGFKVIGKE